MSALIDRAPSGILIFSASKGRELSEESAEQGGGVFTTAVTDALSKNEDGSQPQWGDRGLRTLRHGQTRGGGGDGRPPNPMVRPQRHGRRFRPVLKRRAEDPLKMRRNMSWREHKRTGMAAFRVVCHRLRSLRKLPKIDEALNRLVIVPPWTTVRPIVQLSRKRARPKSLTFFVGPCSVSYVSVDIFLV